MQIYKDFVEKGGSLGFVMNSVEADVVLLAETMVRQVSMVIANV